MRRLTFSVALCLYACSSDATDPPDDDGGVGGSTGAPTGTTTTTGAGAAGGSGGESSGSGTDPLDFPEGDDSAEDATVDDALAPSITAPLRLITGDGDPVGITSDDRVVYTTNAGVFTMKVASGAPPRKAASKAGTVRVQGRTVFNFTDIDYDTDTGYLTVWTPAKGRRAIGIAAVRDDRSAARDDDAYLLVGRNVQETTLDIVILSADKTTAEVLVESAGTGDDDTCAPSYGFAGAVAVVSWCTVGNTAATVARFTLDGQGMWQREDVTTSAQSQWAGDASGQRLFYLSASSQAYVAESGVDRWISDGANWGVFDPTGDIVFLTVGDQLRRSEPTGTPVPIVVQGFGQDVAWTADMSRVVYSNEVIYDEGEKRDLYVTTTGWFNPTPTTLVSAPIAVLGRSVLTAAGNHVLYFTDVVPDVGGALHVVPVTGGAGLTIQAVDTVLAAGGTKILFTDNRTPVGIYPVLVDLKRLDVAGGTAAVLIQTAITDGENIQVRSDGNTVIYRRDGNAAETGIWARPIP